MRTRNCRNRHQGHRDPYQRDPDHRNRCQLKYKTIVAIVIKATAILIVAIVIKATASPVVAIVIKATAIPVVAIVINSSSAQSAGERREGAREERREARSAGERRKGAREKEGKERGRKEGRSAGRTKGGKERGRKEGKERGRKEEKSAGRTKGGKERGRKEGKERGRKEEKSAGERRKRARERKEGKERGREEEKERGRKKGAREKGGKGAREKAGERSKGAQEKGGKGAREREGKGGGARQWRPQAPGDRREEVERSYVVGSGGMNLDSLPRQRLRRLAVKAKTTARRELVQLEASISSLGLSEGALISSVPAKEIQLGPLVRQLSPCSGPESGGNVVHIHGRGFSSTRDKPLLARFGSTVVEVTRLTQEVGRCIAPAHPPGPVAVEVSIGGSLWTRDDIVYTYISRRPPLDEPIAVRSLSCASIATIQELERSAMRHQRGF
ncbi:hypothetical protein CBR_g38674 [Chara braunii]|uniref:IPT/TIG domain-containing protein n=1 Tax=Chara braunii TaxID=69332 RepID=A0A388K0P3_CHABU|nr:hypothetical protein CBR_g38674 [Chara braunii]|eukprot:GBG63608.1 hypothetical protein CBR_g38674 [Chara braunii]